MAERKVNLDNTEHDVVVITLGGQTFRIARVVTGVYQLWGPLMREDAEYLAKVQEYQVELEGIGEGSAENIARTRAIVADVESYATRKIEVFLRIIELLVSKNDQAFNREWWLENASEADFRGFIAACMPQAGNAKKKTGEES